MWKHPRSVGVLVVVFFLAGVIPLPTTPLDAAALRAAAVGDRIGRLTVGLHGVRSGNVDELHCGGTAIHGVVVSWFVIGRTDPEDASVVTLEFNDRPRLAVTYDESDLQQSVAFYAADAGGTIRYVTSGHVDRDRACAVLRDLWTRG